MKDLKKIQEFFSKDVNEANNDYFIPFEVKSEAPNFKVYHIKYPTGDGVLSIGGRDTGSGQERRNGATQAYMIGQDLLDDMMAQYNLEDFEVTDLENGTIQVFMVSDEFMDGIAEADLNDPVAMKMRSAKSKLAKMRKANAGGDGNDKFFKNATKLATLKKGRRDLMRDMEQEAEPEGGPIADEYGRKLNRIDAAIAKLSGRKEMDYDTAVGKEKKSKFKKHGEMSGFDMRGIDEASKGAKNYFSDLKYNYQKAFRYLDVEEREEYKQLAKDFFSKLQVDNKVRAVGLEELEIGDESNTEDIYIEVSIRDARIAMDIMDDSHRGAFEMDGSNFYIFQSQETAYFALEDLTSQGIEVINTNVNLDESFNSLAKKLDKQKGIDKEEAGKIAGAIAAKKMKGAGKGPTSKQLKRLKEEEEDGNKVAEAALILPRGEKIILQAEEEDYKRGLIIELTNEGGYKINYWYGDDVKVYPVEVEVDGVSIKEDAKEVYIKFHPELKEEEGYSPQLVSKENPKGKTKGLTSKTMNNILMNVIKDIKEGEPGLWDNIRAKKASGKKMSPKGSKAYKSAVKAGKRINKAGN